MLSGAAIREQVNSGRIVIDPWKDGHLGPNSYDLTLMDKLKIYRVPSVPDYHSGINPLDVKSHNPVDEYKISESGTILYPNFFYLGCTNEIAGSDHYIPCIEGKSSLARLGIQFHMTAGFGDVGFKGRWTLEIKVAIPVRIYPNMKICQVYFDTVEGPITEKYKGKYVDSDDVIESRSWADFLSE